MAETYFKGNFDVNQIPSGVLKNITLKNGNNASYATFFVTKMKEPDKMGNTHTMYFLVDGKKVYFGKMQEKQSIYNNENNAPKAQEAPKQTAPKFKPQDLTPQDDDLPW